jgi:hypothetical protein
MLIPNIGHNTIASFVGVIRPKPLAGPQLAPQFEPPIFRHDHESLAIIWPPSSGN